MNPSTAMKPVLAPLALAIQLACAGLAAAPALAQNAPAASAISYAIPAGPLGVTLNRFVAASGVFVVADDRLTVGKNSAGLRGVHGPNEALTQLLAGTGLQAVMQASGGFALRPVDTLTPAIGATTLSAVTVTANLESAAGPTVGYVAKRSAAGTKTDTPLLEIAQTINVVTADEIRARGAISVSQALRYTPGVTASGYTENYMLADEMSSRSFSPAPLYLDGAYMPYAGSLGGAPQIEPYSLERVEVFKGPASVLYGQNQPGGIINMVTKKPQADAVREVLVGVGSYGRVNAALDIGGAVDENSELLYRLLVLANDGKQQTDHTRSSRTFVAPSLTWKPSADTTLTLSAQLQHDKGVPDYQALPAIGSLFAGPDGQRISRNFFNGEPGYNDFWRKQAVLAADFSHRFSDALKLQSKLLFVDVKDDWKGFYLQRFADIDGVTDYRRATRNKLDWTQHNNVLSLDNNLEFKARTGEVSHTLLAGLDYRRFSRKYDGYNNYSAPAVDLYTPDYGVRTGPAALTTRWDNTVDQIGLYLQDQMRWRDLVLTVGGRHDWAGIDNKDLLENTTTRQDDKAFTGRAGLTWLAGNGWAPYASYSESFVPTLGTDFSGKPFKPSTGRQLELGVKYQPAGADVMVTFSVIDIRQQNVTTADHAHPGFSVQTGEVKSQGAELEAKARLWKRLDLVAGLGYMDAYTRRSNTDSEIGRNVAAEPRWTASLWTSYMLQPGVNIGGGLRWAGSAYANDANTYKTPAYALFDASLRLDLGLLSSSLRGVEGTLSVQNLFDKRYVSNCNYAFGCYYGKARTVAAGAVYRW